MKELTVSMPAWRAGRYIERAVTSVLEQADVDLELIVVDDASRDGTARVLAAFDDPRLRVVRNATRRGIGHCHNRVVAESASPLVAHVDADDFILPGALRSLVDAVRSHSVVGQAFCDFFPVDSAGQASAARTGAWLDWLDAVRRRELRDPGRALLVYGMFANHLRTYPRVALEAVGPFDERLPFAVDYEMALRLADRFGFVRVPEALYARRIHDAATTALGPGRDRRMMRVRHAICRDLLARNGGRLLGRGPLRLRLLQLEARVRAAARSHAAVPDTVPASTLS